VPLVLRYPGTIPAGTRYEGLVSGVDLVPTLLDLMGLPAIARVHGVSHAAALTGRGPVRPRAPVYAESLYPERAYGWAAPRALRTRDDKFIDAPEPEYYRLADDPGERGNLAASEPEAVRDGKRRLLAALQEFGEPDAAAAAPMSSEQRAALESLGYVAGGGTRRAGTPAPDPKRLVAVHDTFLRARALVASGDLVQVRRLVEEILAADPENPGALALGGTVAAEEGRTGGGIAALREAAGRSPTVFENWWNLATALHRAGRVGEAVSAYRAAAALQPSNGGVWHGLGNALLAAGDAPGAVTALERGLRSSPASASLLASLGAALDAAGEPARAVRTLEDAVARNGSLAPAWNKLGVLAERGGRRAEAKSRYDRALAADPNLADALFNRGKLALLERRFDDAARDAARLTGAHPDYALGWFLRGQAAAVRGDRDDARRALERYLATPEPEPKLAAAAREILGRSGR
jgi:tetratricopeptide (TPR) repeat protein